MPDPKVCQTCRFFHPNGRTGSPGREPDGHCHRFPPVGSSYESIWPPIFECEGHEAYCGEWTMILPAPPTP